MPKITSVEVGLGVTFQPRERESVSMDLAIRADLSEQDNVRDTVAYLHRNIRHLIDANIAPFLQKTKRITTPHTFLVVDGEPEIDLGQPDDGWSVEAKPQPTINSLNVRWGQTWEVKPWEFLKSDLKMLIELEEGDEPTVVAQTYTDQLKLLVRANAQPVLEQAGYFKRRGYVPTLNLSNLDGKTQLPTPETVLPADVESDAGIALSL